MTNQTLFLLNTGPVTGTEMQYATSLLANSWGCEHTHHHSTVNPNEVLKKLPERASVIQICGDPAAENQNNCTWIEALSSWRKPTLLFTKQLGTGKIPGTASAYVALCEKFKLPLIGIIQIAGEWEPRKRKSDGLPWCGWLPEEKAPTKQDVEDLSMRNSHQDLVIKVIEQRLSILKI
ncbi:hypothetical protein [Prochlorococcus sp. MIT 1341]|uniref:hypothetical protein n=1 Tax=Prochlorococcus sp. MIT 1341 TaxID=3096221 RepID=UPI002A75A5A5|nr:hypothetical protein [Prochlorococcus sp. MIT 1341]